MANNELKVNHNYQTVIGDYPKIGIRPVIDGGCVESGSLLRTRP
jgi:hypothetical protein